MTAARQELVRATQQDRVRERQDRRWIGDLRGERHRDGTLWIFRLPRRR